MRAKLVIVGPPEAGKSTLVELISDSAINLSHRGRTVAMDHGSLRVNDSEISVIGVPGQHRFAPIREVLIQKATAAIWVHPGGQPPDLSTVSLLEKERLPYAVVVNQRLVRELSRDGRFKPPSNLQRPFSVIVGNLAVETGIGNRITRMIWQLVHEQSVRFATE